jgi:P4 family phage/plasmid primase-like protien
MDLDVSPYDKFLEAHRTYANDYTHTAITGGKFKIDRKDQNLLFDLHHEHVFGKTKGVSYLLEKHTDVGPLYTDMDFRYEGGVPLHRRFNVEQVHEFISHQIAAMLYFSHIEDLPKELDFYLSLKPGPEVEKGKHKDGLHIQSPNVTINPEFQYAIRGFLLTKKVVSKIFGNTDNINTESKTYDVSVIQRNNLFLYGACKQNKAPYSVVKLWRIKTRDIKIAMETFDINTISFEDLVPHIKDLLKEQALPRNNRDIINLLSIRRHTTLTPLQIRESRAGFWGDLMVSWGSGRENGENIRGGGGAVLANRVDDEIVPLPIFASKDEIHIAYRICNECLNPERRAGIYQDWVNLAICLKNIANTEDSFNIWVAITRRVDPIHKKAHLSEDALRAKWNNIRIGTTQRRLGIGSLHHWANEDNPIKRRDIMSESLVTWIIQAARMTHVSIAQLVHRLYKYEFRCCLNSQRRHEWYQFPTGSHSWIRLRSAIELRIRLSKEVQDKYAEAWRELGKRANALPRDSEEAAVIEERRKLIRTIEHNLEMTSFKNNVMNECDEQFYDDEFINKLNSDPYTVGVANGVIVLRYSEHGDTDEYVNFRDGLPDDNISFVMGRCDMDPVGLDYKPYDPTDPEQIELMEIIKKIYPDSELREYVLKIKAGCLEGANREQKFYVMRGVGSNGKSMMEYLDEKTFGDYGTSISTTVFTRKKPDSGAANPDIITIHKRRYIHTGEPDDNEKINTAIMKQFTGGDSIQARALFGEQEKFSVKGKIFMSCNDLPPVSKMDNGTWRRLRVIPHNSIFKDHGDPTIDPSKHIYEKDLFLENKLFRLRGAYLSLLVHYYNTYYIKESIIEPACVLEASNKYKEENDLFNRFFNDNFVFEPAADPISAREVRDIFREWKKAQGRSIDLKESVMYDRLKEICLAGSDNKNGFFGIRISDAEDCGGFAGQRDY